MAKKKKQQKPTRKSRPAAKAKKPATKLAKKPKKQAKPARKAPKKPAKKAKAPVRAKKPAPKAAAKAAAPKPKAKAAAPKPTAERIAPAVKAAAPVALERQRRVLPDDERLPAAPAATPAAAATDVTWSDALATDPADEILGELEGEAAEDDVDDEFGGGGDDEDWK